MEIEEEYRNKRDRKAKGTRKEEKGKRKRRIEEERRRKRNRRDLVYVGGRTTW